MNALLLAYLAQLMEASRQSRRILGSEGMRDWLEDLLHEDPGVREAASRLLVSHGESAIPVLIELLEHPEAGIRDWASTTLFRIGKDAVPSLRLLSREPRPAALVQEARRILRRMGDAG